MSKAKDRERAETILYRSGVKVDRASWEKYQSMLKKFIETQKLKLKRYIYR